MDAKLSVAGGSVRSVTTSDTAHQDKNRVLRTRDDAEVLRRLGLFQARSTAAGRGGARVAGASGRHTRRPAGPHAAAYRPRTVRTDLARPRLPGPCTAGRLPGHRRTRRPGGAGQPAAGPLRRPGPHRRRRLRRYLHDRLAAHGLAVSPSAADAVRPAAPRARPSALPRHGAPLRPDRRLGPQRDVLHRRRAGVRRRGGGGRRSAVGGTACTPWARCWSRRSRTRRCCTGGAPGGSRRGWPPGSRSTRSAPPRRLPHRATRPAAVGPARARHRAAVRPARRRRVGRATRRHVRRLDPGRRPRCPVRRPSRTSSTTSPPCSRRSGRADTSRSATSTPSRAGAGRCRRPCWPPCCPTRR